MTHISHVTVHTERPIPPGFLHADRSDVGGHFADRKAFMEVARAVALALQLQSESDVLSHGERWEPPHLGRVLGAQQEVRPAGMTSDKVKQVWRSDLHCLTLGNRPYSCTWRAATISIWTQPAIMLSDKCRQGQTSLSLYLHDKIVITVLNNQYTSPSVPLDIGT